MMTSTALRMKKRRKILNITQKVVAAHLSMLRGADIDTRQISNWENGRCYPSATNLSHLAEILKTTTDYLLGRTDVA